MVSNVKKLRVFSKCQVKKIGYHPLFCLNLHYTYILTYTYECWSLFINCQVIRKYIPEKQEQIFNSKEATKFRKGEIWVKNKIETNLETTKKTVLLMTCKRLKNEIWPYLLALALQGQQQLNLEQKWQSWFSLLIGRDIPHSLRFLAPSSATLPC